MADKKFAARDVRRMLATLYVAHVFAKGSKSVTVF